MATFSQILGKLTGGTGKYINKIGNALGNPLPEYHISENLQRIGGMLNPVKSVSAAELTPTQSGSYYPNYANNLGNMAGLNTSGGSAGSGGQPIAPFDLGGNQDINLTDQAYQNSRADIEAQNPILDQSYNLAKGDIQRGIDTTQQTGEQQTTAVNQRYGDILKNQLKTYQDIGRQRQGTFSSLGTLESSAFGEQQARADQSLAEGKTQTGLNQAADVKNIEDTVKTYVANAQSEIGQLGLQYQQGKNAIATALANNDIQGAAAIKNTIDQIKTRALTLYSLMGTAVNKITGITGESYANTVANQLAGLTSAGNTQYSLPQTTDQGQGFIAPNGKKYRNYQDYLNSLG